MLASVVSCVLCLFVCFVLLFFGGLLLFFVLLCFLVVFVGFCCVFLFLLGFFGGFWGALLGFFVCCFFVVVCFLFLFFLLFLFGVFLGFLFFFGGGEFFPSQISLVHCYLIYDPHALSFLESWSVADVLLSRDWLSEVYVLIVLVSHAVFTCTRKFRTHPA